MAEIAAAAATMPVQVIVMTIVWFLFLRLMLSFGEEMLEGDVDAVGINGKIHGDASFLKIEDFWIVNEHWSLDHVRNIISFSGIFSFPENSW